MKKYRVQWTYLVDKSRTAIVEAESEDEASEIASMLEDTDPRMVEQRDKTEPLNWEVEEIEND